MHLKSIKLSGFKSFVDPTNVPIKSNLVAVVGPNGSGKSNIIDAVRWVMGESSAKYLRGESMTDVIFNGSSGRKPAAHASIELVFDNSLGKLTGQYGAYNEFSVKREVTRDGQSNYYFNGSKCRRKDIKDIFLGTGLGPRSYAIIMQDTISRLVEAKPEEFRGYLEEVAGISKYKERRHETELRIKHTRENLERLTDVRDELETQLKRLDRQAKAAERYKVLKQEERLTKGQLAAIQWQQYHHQQQQRRQAILQCETEVEAAVTQVRHIDSQFETLHESHTDANETVNDAQAHYYQLAAEISRIEQQQKHDQERAQQLSTDLQQVEQTLSTAQQQQQQDQHRFTELTEQQALLSPQLEEVSLQAEESQEALLEFEQKVNEWQQKWDEFNDQAQTTTRQAEVEQTRLQHLSQRQQELEKQRQQLEQAKQALVLPESDAEIAMLSESIATLEAQQEQGEIELDDFKQHLLLRKDALTELNRQQDEHKSQLRRLQGQMSSLQALQKAALEQKDQKVTAWLKQYGLAEAPKLAQTIEVKSGWEKAVETVLGYLLDATTVEDLLTHIPNIAQLSKGHLSLVARETSAIANSHTGGLADYVTGNPAIQALLRFIHPVENLQQAQAQLPQLNSGESIITQDGVWLGHGWMRVCHGVDAQSGVIERQKELSHCEQHIEAVEAELDEYQQQMQALTAELADVESQQEAKQFQLRQLQSQLADSRAKLHVKRSEIQQQQQRYQQLVSDLATTEADLASTQDNLSQVKQAWNTAMSQATEDAQTRDTLLTQRDESREELQQRRQLAQQYQQQTHQLTLNLQKVSSEYQALSQTLSRSQENLTHLEERQQQLTQAIYQAQQPLEDHSESLETLLNQQAEAEDQLRQAREVTASMDQKMRELTQQRQTLESQLEKARQNLEQQRMGSENIRVRQETITEQLQEMDFNLDALIADLPAEANEIAWQDQLHSIERRISRLGAINLAAIDEFYEVSTRKKYLDEQNTDLENALSVLETAIKKIDNETRQKFKETYETVNGYFQGLFPKIFGGGSASLTLTSDDLLDTGVSVMARPPGKRNSTIHLLSGGEKALTALALVFSLFQINPAPFCMLDEVDAPLDDANVARYCNLVKEMSKDIQFVFISHNKLAIEMGNQLVGVTMREPGVSRLVAVDVEEAVAMAES